MRGKETKKYETDLYKPVKEHFTEQGYDVYGEVNHCDVVAVQGDELVIVELKLTANMDLLIQSTLRQRLTNFVYIAIPKPKYSLRSKKWKDLCYLLRRLELGLLMISFKGEDAKAELIFPPGPFDRKKSMSLSTKKRNALLVEIKGRTGDFNIGGSTQTQIMSAYKENSIHIACCLVQSGALSTRDLRQMGTGDKTTSILYENHYEWFERVRRGVYQLTEKGESELQLYPDLVKHYTNLIKR